MGPRSILERHHIRNVLNLTRRLTLVMFIPLVHSMTFTLTNGKHQTTLFVFATGQWEGCGEWFYCYSVNIKIIHEGRGAFAKFVEFHCWNKCENFQRLFLSWFDLEKNEQISIDSMLNFSFGEKWWHFHSLNVKFLPKLQFEQQRSLECIMKKNAFQTQWYHPLWVMSFSFIKGEKVSINSKQNKIWIGVVVVW